jgi:hypothetical protein
MEILPLSLDCPAEMRARLAVSEDCIRDSEPEQTEPGDSAFRSVQGLAWMA